MVTELLRRCDALGHGLIEFTLVAGQTSITQCRANAPLKLLTPRSRNGIGWIFASTYGGGLVGGDVIRMDVTAGAKTRCLLSTQASTKIYRSVDKTSHQVLNVNAEGGAIVVVAPDPIACYAGASFEQRQRFNLAGDAALVMVDWFTSGRKARGERWAFRRYQSSSEIHVNQHCIFRDVLRLDSTDGHLDGEMRMGRIDCFATVVIIGPVFDKLIEKILNYIETQPARGEESLIFSAGPLPGGLVLRVGGTEVEAVGRWLRKQVAGLDLILGQDPWLRKS